MLAYLARYTHRVAISNSRLIALDEAGVTFKWKDYRIKGRDRLKAMTLDAGEFIRRSLCTCCPAASTASATTACSPPRFEPATSSASDNCSPLPRLRPEARTRTPTARPKHLRTNARVAAAA